jgi:hypothetical protein
MLAPHRHDATHKHAAAAATRSRSAEWLEESMEAHAEAFHIAKKPRKLSFASTLGVVDLDLKIGGAVQSFTVSPVLAALILPFEEHSCLTPAQLSAATNVPLEILLRKCARPLAVIACHSCMLPSALLPRYCAHTHIQQHSSVRVFRKATGAFSLQVMHGLCA